MGISASVCSGAGEATGEGEDTEISEASSTNEGAVMEARNMADDRRKKYPAIRRQGKGLRIRHYCWMVPGHVVGENVLRYTCPDKQWHLGDALSSPGNTGIGRITLTLTLSRLGSGG